MNKRIIALATVAIVAVSIVAVFQFNTIQQTNANIDLKDYGVYLNPFVDRHSFGVNVMNRGNLSLDGRLCTANITYYYTVHLRDANDAMYEESRKLSFIETGIIRLQEESEIFEEMVTLKHVDMAGNINFEDNIIDGKGVYKTSFSAYVYIEGFNNPIGCTLHWH